MPRYTKADMRRLAEVSAPGSIPSAFLPELNYCPQRFKKMLLERGLREDVKYLYELPLEDIMPLMAEQSKIGYLMFRMEVGK
jgi:hypothetical protein